MTVDRWIKTNTESLVGKTVAITGSTGGLGRVLCRHLAQLGADLILLDRNTGRSEAFRDELLCEFPAIGVQCVRMVLDDMGSVRQAVTALRDVRVDVLIHNAGAYSIPRRICDTGWDNVFQINFVSPYYITRCLLPNLRAVHGKVVVVGSIAHDYSKTDPADIDFHTRTKASKVYGNAKRFLMFSMFELFRNEREVTLSVTHPGITFTNITAHYPKVVFTLIKHPMKVIFMRPRKACLSVLGGIFQTCEDREWIGPRWFDVWGFPKKKPLDTASEEEIHWIGERAECIAEQFNGKNQFEGSFKTGG